ncbi:MAG: AmmeMemoRadiSam system protein A [Candidatus Brocadiia bacterium]
MLSEEARDELLDIARKSVESAVRGETVPELESDNEKLQDKVGAFVTLKTNGHLRGCLGRFTSDLPLWETVQKMAVAAATEDPRFMGNRIQPEELDQVKIEISVLSPLEKTDDPMELELGTHGIYVQKGRRTGCFLPQVATETGWSKEEFLQRCCSGKAGLSPDAWKDPDTDVYLFTAEVIGENG